MLPTRTDWRQKPRVQMPDYSGSEDALAAVEEQLRRYPPLVFAGEARRLRRELGDAAQGRAFLLQGGDCAESFAEFSADTIPRSLVQLALRAAERASEVREGQDAAILDTVARVHFELGNLDQAIQWQRRAIEQDPRDDAQLRQALEKYISAKQTSEGAESEQ